MSLNMLGAFDIGSTMLGDDLQVNAVDAGGGTVHGESRVAGSMSMAAGPQAAVATGTAVTARLGDKYGLPSVSVSARSTVAGALITTTLRGGTSACGTTVAGSTLNLFQRIPKIASGTPAGRTTVHGAIYLASLTLSGGHAAGQSLMSGNLTKPVSVAGSTITAATAVTGDSTIHILRGVIPTRTTVVAQVVNKGKLTCTVATRTTLAAALRLKIALYGGNITGVSVIKGRLHDYPSDFQDVYIRTESVITGALRISTLISSSTVSPIVCRTVTSVQLIGKLGLYTAGVTARTVVTGKTRYGFGADLSLRTAVRSRLGIQTGINSFKGATVHGVTVVSGVAPSNGFRGTCSGATTLVVTMTLEWAVTAAMTCQTQFHSHFNGRFAHDGPFGSVALTQVPHGDMGIPDEIDGSTSPTADITVERHRMLVLLGNAALSVDKSLVAHGTAIGGTGIRQVGTPVNLSQKVNRLAVHYV